MAYTDIDKPTDYFNTVLYTGNGGTQSITGVGFQPDLVWMKSRSVAGAHHLVNDVVRGADKGIFTNLTTAEITRGVSSFDSDGFSFDDNAGGDGNASGSSQVAWNWKAGGTASSNTNGSITSSVSANQDAGFSIVSYTGDGTDGATVGHGLGVKPNMIILKPRNATNSWVVYHSTLGATKYLLLNTTAAAGTTADAWNNTEPTSSVFSIATEAGGWNNHNGNNYIAYCFAEKKGYSKFGSYTGNNLDDGTFCYTGMKPSFVMIKRTDSTSEWNIYDVKRNPFNLTNLELEANTSDAEANVSEREIDILSNGFKLRGRSTFINAPGGSYINMAFAENPFVTSTGIPTTAR